MHAYPQKTRANVFKLHNLGYTYGEISAETNVSPGTIFNWVKEARFANKKAIVMRPKTATNGKFKGKANGTAKGTTKVKTAKFTRGKTRK